MHFLRLFIFLPFPLFIFAFPLSNRYAESFIYYFQEERFLESLQTLDEWEIFKPEQKSKITGMRAAVYLSKGDLEKGSLLMDKFIHSLSDEEYTAPHFLDFIYFPFLGL